MRLVGAEAEATARVGFSRDKLKRLERRGDLSHFKLADGSMYYYDPLEAKAQIFLYATRDYQGAQEEEAPPEILQAICQAEDRAAVIEDLLGDSNYPLSFSIEVLRERGELAKLAWAEEAEDLSEP
jgi:hypothetical protein